MFIFVIGLIGCSSGESDDTTQDDQETTEEQTQEEDEEKDEEATPSSGGTLQIAVGQQPNTIDPLVTTATATAYAAKPIFESLLTINENYEIEPMLAESYEVSDDAKTITFKLREGIKFHNGQEMTADDVLASMNRWVEMSGFASSALANPRFEKVDDTTVALQMDEPSTIALYIVADTNQLAAIMPKDIVESAEATGVTEYIGTGPFKFVEWKTDQYIHYAKFEDYQPRTEPASGLAGEKLALVDEIFWNFVDDESTRLSGLISGDYDISLGISHDNVKQVESTDGLVPEIWTYGMELLVFNKKQGLFTDVRMRQAVNMALDKEAILLASFGDEQFFELEHGLYQPHMTDWYSDAGADLYNPKDIEGAKALLEEAGYNGEEVVILTSRQYPHYYNAAVATQQQLENIGMNVTLDIYDWATLLDRRSDPELWDIFFTGWDTQIIPHQYGFLDSENEWPGWTKNAEIDRLLDEIGRAENQDEAKALMHELQTEFWNDLPVINLGLFNNTDAYNEKVKGFKNFVGPVLWNVSIEE